MIILILDFPEESDVLDKSGFDMFIIHELAKNIKFFPQKLVSEVDLGKKKKKGQIKKVGRVTHTSSDPCSVASKTTCIYSNVTLKKGIYFSAYFILLFSTYLFHCFKE